MRPWYWGAKAWLFSWGTFLGIFEGTLLKIHGKILDPGTYILFSF